jgi:hypothetical protein
LKVVAVIEVVVVVEARVVVVTVEVLVEASTSAAVILEVAAPSFATVHAPVTRNKTVNAALRMP